LGFLNGHTPFSALVAFISALTSILTARKHICLSNESSANEPTIPGTKINHQYSKSFEFEKAFRQYLENYVTADINYFSFLRPLNELQIAKLFSVMLKYQNDFRSCNRGSKTNSWCGKCSKCLFTFIILYPYLEEKKLINIFGNNLFDDPGLRNIFDELTGASAVKPFECVGTINEVNAALCMTIENRGKNKLPVLLEHYKSTAEFEAYTKNKTLLIEKQFDENNFLPEEYKNIIKQALC